MRRELEGRVMSIGACKNLVKADVELAHTYIECRMRFGAEHVQKAYVGLASVGIVFECSQSARRKRVQSTIGLCRSVEVIIHIAKLSCRWVHAKCPKMSIFLLLNYLRAAGSQHSD